MRYFQRFWDELRGIEQADWGCSWWYFETDDQGNVTRQIENYYSGPLHRYDKLHPEDHYGGLSKVALNLVEFAQFEIPRERFEAAWNLDKRKQRCAFADFLERLALKKTGPEDWFKFAVTHYFDKTLEEIRRELVRLSIEEPEGEPSIARQSQFRSWAETLRSSLS